MLAQKKNEFRISMESVYKVGKALHEELLCALVHQFSESEPHDQMTFVRNKKIIFRFFNLKYRP